MQPATATHLQVDLQARMAATVAEVEERMHAIAGQVTGRSLLLLHFGPQQNRNETLLERLDCPSACIWC